MDHLTPKEAAKFLHDNPSALFVDCRSEMEFLLRRPSGGRQCMCPGTTAPTGKSIRTFVGEVKKLAGHSFDRPVVLICRSGNRSVDAGHALEGAGFTQVYNVLHGFEGELDDNHHRGAMNGWRFEGLPWEQC
jgi:rhodanese-related sulfurtransferase